MYLYPSDIFEKLEFDKILERLSTYCMGRPAYDMIMSMKVFNHKIRIERMLDEVVEFLKVLDLQLNFPIVHYESIVDELRLLRTIDYVLEIDSYVKLFIHIQSIYQIVAFFNDKDNKEHFPLLFEIASQISIDEDLIKRFDKISNIAILGLMLPIDFKE